MPEVAGRWTSRQTGPEEPERQEESRRGREGSVSRQEGSTGTNAAQGSSETRPAKCP